jgi:hypothetical protein
MTDCEYCGEQVKKDDDFVLVGKYPSGWKKWEGGMTRYSSPEDFGTIYHKSCYDEMIKKETAKQ